MAARLGDVLYWLGCAVAALLLVFTAVAAYAVWADPNAQRGDAGLFAVAGPVLAVIAWAIGRACRYVLAAR